MRVSGVVVFVVAGGLVMTAQTPSFDVASVKVNRSAAEIFRIAAPAETGRLDVTNAPLRTLILNAYGLQDFQLVGGPAWIGDARFDIAARTRSSTTRDDISAMLRTLLADRFHLITHRETREMPTFALIPARGDGRLGPQMKLSTTNCAAARGPTQGPAPATTSGQLLCTTRIGPGSLNAGAMTMSRLATTLGGFTGRIVRDETGLTGVYDLLLTFTPETGGGPSGPGLPQPAIDPNAPSLMAAIPEQLGLRLEPRRSPVDVVVVDRVEMPTED